MEQYGGNPNIFNYYGYKLKFASKRTYDDVKLLNKGRVKKASGTLEHKDLSKMNFSDGWVGCNGIEVDPNAPWGTHDGWEWIYRHKTMFYLRCYNNGVLYVGQDPPNYSADFIPTEDSVTFPVCDTWDRSGNGYSTGTALCDTSELGPYQNNVLKKKKKNGVDVFECPKNVCYRFCDHEYLDELNDYNNCDRSWDKTKFKECIKENKRKWTQQPVKCEIDWATGLTSWVTKDKGSSWKDAKPFVPSEQPGYENCAV